ncbi:hypothetical protein DICPUDRAFT_97729 [Dictyostelium purpureum]|uniref:DIRP domain-containing protein n=1 Tax=Dictyostelium purpureum TaxID=5786 RepID=F0ZJB2_DICPU|nr:uncharacterized protein DICPUDRAFT_97729 [Dictyostelium purpureum]EGC35947.1 hypothetical protein DICPUDRAFT_97729 [Dictyostelium purpureum]|eukprot:XP_003287520.1 hypothetical protein DICPUDRAFT_97729 [Dictyostelium purpureum]
MKGSPLRGRSTPRKKLNQQQQQQQDDNGNNDEEDTYNHPNLGPPWDLKEITDFFHIAKKGEVDWKTALKKFPNRTEEMLKQIYNISKPISSYSAPEFLLFFIQGVYKQRVFSQIEQPQPLQQSLQSQPTTKLPPHHSQLQQLQLLKQQKEALREQKEALREQQQQSPTKTSSRGRTIYDNNTFNISNNNSNNSNNTNNTNNNSNNNSSYSIDNLGQNNNFRPKARRLFPPSETTTTTTTATITTPQFDSPSKRKINSKESSPVRDGSPSLPAKLRNKIKNQKHMLENFQMSPNSVLNNNNRIDQPEDEDNDDHKHLLEFQRSSSNTPQRPFTSQQQHFQHSILQSPVSDNFQIEDNNALIPSKENQNIIQKRLVNFLSKQKQPNPKSIISLSNNISSNNDQLKLSKPGRWATYEWFYSDLDTPFFFFNEFQLFIHQLQLPKKLTRMEWNAIRSRMRKPRRLSQQFYYDARNKLDRTREAVRQSMMSNESLKFLQIEPNSKVLYIYDDALENGKVVSYNRISKTYSIISDKTNKVVEIPDEEVMSADKDVRYCIEQSHLQSKEKNQPNENNNNNHNNSINNNIINNNIINNNINNINNNINGNNISSPYKGTPYKRKFEEFNKFSSPTKNINNNINNNNSINTVLTHPDQVVTLVVGLTEVLERKQNLLSKIHEMNEEAKSMVLSGYPLDFQKKYSELLISIEYHNSVLQTLLEIFRRNNYTRRISKVDEYQTNDKKTLLPELIELYKTKSEEFINDVDKEHQHKEQHKELKDERLKKLVTSMISFIFHIKNQSVNIEFSKEDIDFIFGSCLDQIKPKSSENLELFKEIESKVEQIKNNMIHCKSE